MFALLLAVLLQAPAQTKADPPKPHTTPPPAQWHKFHNRPLVEVNQLLASPVVVVTDPTVVYARVVNGVVVQTYQLVPVAAAPPVVVVPERHGWLFRWRR